MAYKCILGKEQVQFIAEVLYAHAKEHGIESLIKADPERFYKFREADIETQNKILAGEMEVEDI